MRIVNCKTILLIIPKILGGAALVHLGLGQCRLTSVPEPRFMSFPSSGLPVRPPILSLAVNGQYPVRRG
jgi:hypothetical protein